MKKLRFAVLGTGFWANYQIPAWQELEGVELVAVYNRTRSKAETIAQRFGVPRVYDDVNELLQREELDFVDIITDVDTHPAFVKLAAGRGLDVICQKPMALSLAQAQSMVEVCQQAGVKFFIHENFRWQAPIRAVKKALDSGVIGEAFKARVSFCSGFPVFDNQPFLAELEQFILTDIGSHVLDVCRFLLGEAKSLYCLTRRVNPKIKGEDVAHVLMEMESGLHCYAEMSYASILEKEAFPQTLVLIEGEKGSIWLTNDFELKITTRSGKTRSGETRSGETRSGGTSEGTTSEFIKPDLYPWADPDYAVVHSSIVDCNRDILNGLRGGASETTGEDNFRTMQLVWGSYQSAAEGRVLML